MSRHPHDSINPGQSIAREKEREREDLAGRNDSGGGGSKARKKKKGKKREKK